MRIEDALTVYSTPITAPAVAQVPYDECVIWGEGGCVSRSPGNARAYGRGQESAEIAVGVRWHFMMTGHPKKWPVA